MKKPVLLPVACALLSLIMIACSSGSKTTATTTGLKFRAAVSQDVQGVIFGGLILINAEKDLRAPIQPIGPSFKPGMLVESNDHKFTLAVSSTFDAIEVMDNVKEAISLSDLALPGATESVVISPDNTTAYAAVPTAPVAGGGTTGGIVIASLAATTTTTSTLPVPGAHFVIQSGDGSQLLVFSDNSDAVTVVSPFNILPGQKNDTCNPPAPDPVVCQVVSGFDRPVAGFFSSDNTQAWILNCGPECGGVQASVQTLDLHDPANPVAGVPTPIPGGATVGLIKGQTLYVAGNPPVGSNTCAGGPTTSAITCGRLTIVDLTSLSATAVQPAEVIPDGYHNKIDISGNGQLFVGSSNCSNVVPVNPGDEQRGCLAILNTNNGNLIIPPDNGDVTGLQPITNRTVFYVVEGGQLRIYDTTTDKIYTVASINILGNAVDVKLIDF
ncbi:MAG TPA: hypothetical protein VLL05_15025 [Terriglobales bacterium]|nr:hypothetical protein [Terriglobales bacterium]